MLMRWKAGSADDAEIDRFESYPDVKERLVLHGKKQKGQVQRLEQVLRRASHPAAQSRPVRG
jgi:hypothetical protein